MNERGRESDRGKAGAGIAPAADGRIAWPLRSYPFLFSLYPALNLYLLNISEVRWTQALWALLFSLVVLLAGWLGTRLVSGCRETRLLLLFLFLLFFHFYGLFYELIAGLLPGQDPLLLAHGLAFFLLGGAWLLLSRAALRVRGPVREALNRGLGIAVICLIAWNLGGILLHHGRAILRPQGERDGERPIAAVAPSRSPDIYLFILDEFAAIEAVRALFDYDGSPLAGSLRQLGFFVAQGSRAPFLKTELALASYLNLGERNGGSDPYARIRRNAVGSFLKRRGYRIIEFPVAASMFMEEADERHDYSLAGVSIFFDDFYRVLFERSLLRFLPDMWQRRAPDSARYYRERILQVFKKLPEVAKSPGPKFVFVHLLCPHEPFVFDSHGGGIPSAHFWDHADPRYYRQQYIFVSSKIAETAAMILASSPRPPVIVLQSDHGYRGSLGRKKWIRKISERDATQVFNALFLPGVSAKSLDSDLSPLNNFRLIFNAYFGTHYPLLPNP